LRGKPLSTNTLGWFCVLVASIAAAFGADNDKPKLAVRPAADYPHHQASESVTIAAQPYESDEDAKQAFGKINPWRFGVLPVLIVVQNDGPDSINLEKLRFSYELPDRTRVDNTPTQDVKYLDGAQQPKVRPNPIGRNSVSHPKSPLAEWEIEGRAFAAKMLPPGQSASGFVYFQTPRTSAAAHIVIDGMVHAPSGKEFYYFEIPMS
jgi:hypothetical protein